MKNARMGIAITLLAVIAYACSSTISTMNANTSLVTIKVGSDKVASIDIQRTTLLAKLQRILAGILNTPTAYAYIPTVVQSIRATATAADITAVTATADVSTALTATLTLEVPNGSSRLFTVDGVSSSGTLTYRGSATTDLTGAPVSLSVTMAYVGSGIYVNAATGSDSTGDGSQANPYQTITYALSISPGNEAILVEAGTYVSPPETFPLQLKTGTKLICLGPSFSSVINSDSANSDAIYGSLNASIENCQILPGCDSTGIDDLSTIITINHVLIDEASPGCGPLNSIILSADSMVNESIIKNDTFHAIDVVAGSPVIKNNTIIGGSLSTNGILVESGNSIIQNNTITDNQEGISVTSGNPVISNNTIFNNTSYGISVIGSTTTAVINNNSIYCNSAADLTTSSLTAINITNNNWDHDASTIPSGPTSDNASCIGGVDICYAGGVLPTYSPVGPAVSGGCL